MGYFILMGGIIIFALVTTIIALHQDKKEIHQPAK